jgi:calcium-translocating P-type ATPase
VAKEASDIVILDDNFSSIVKAVMWGRSVFDNIRKFLQFQLTVNIVALTLTLVSAITGREPPLNAVMMLWVNLIMDTMGALALGTEPPSHLLLKRRPYKRNASLISNTMIRNIGVQFIYQLALLAYLLLLGAEDFGVADESKVHYTVIFNAFVFCQVFNEINARSIGDDMNVFKGLFSNPLFMEIIIFTVVAQYLMVEFAGDFMRTAALTKDQWIKSVLLGSLSLPLGGLMRMIPVSESEADFAQVSPLIKNVVDADREASRKAAAEQKDAHMTPSYLAWLAVCGASVALTLAEFSGLWMGHLWRFLATSH